MIVLDGIRRMYFEEEDIFYYITLLNENYEHPVLPMGATEGICRGIYRLSERDLGPKQPKVQLLGSGAILRESLRAQEILESQFGVSSNVYSVTSYKSLLLRRPRVRALEPAAPRPAAAAAVRAAGAGRRGGPIVAALDYVGCGGRCRSPLGRPADYVVLGTDGFGRSEARKELRRFFEVDAENIALAALSELAAGQVPKDKLAAAIRPGLDPRSRTR